METKPTRKEERAREEEANLRAALEEEATRRKNETARYEANRLNSQEEEAAAMQKRQPSPQEQAAADAAARRQAINENYGPLVDKAEEINQQIGGREGTALALAWRIIRAAGGEGRLNYGSIGQVERLLFSDLTGYNS